MLYYYELITGKFLQELQLMYAGNGDTSHHSGI